MPVPYGSRFNASSHASIGALQSLPGQLSTEPMNLGSPSTSPHSTHAHIAYPNTQYLPGFLMGDTIAPVSNHTYSPAGVYQNTRSMQLSPTAISPSPLGTPKQNQDRLYKRISSPPTQSLWSMNHSGAMGRTNPGLENWDVNGFNNAGVQHYSGGNPLNRSIAPMSPFLSPRSATSKNPLQSPMAVRPMAGGIVSPTPCGTLSSDHLVDVLTAPKSANHDRLSQNCWVTVFGYPASRASYILSQFAQFGTIEKHVVTNDGNWMHIKYQNKLQARCALNRNGRVFGDNIMVGVTPCSDEDVMNDKIAGMQLNDPVEDRENSVIRFQSPIPITRPVTTGTPLREMTEIPRTCPRNPKLMNQSFVSPPERQAAAGPGACGVARHSSMRSLTGEGRPAYLSRTASVRQTKESGLLSKALGYMFGWS